jgi:16S rRNA (cytosine1402-N4)-methyltransferase
MPQFSPHVPARHQPVMLAEVLGALQPCANDIYVDGTFGAGGYTRAILAAAPCRVIALDRDPAAITGGQDLLSESKGRLTLVRRTFGKLRDVVREQGLTHVDGVVLDIGVSSMQLDEADRGFSFMRDGPLDMRMSQDGASAADHINSLEVNELSRVIFILGEEPRARSIARAIVSTRTEQPLRTTLDLVRAVESATGPQRPQDRTHPATRTFQAFRILVNHELTELAEALIAAEETLKVGGRLVVVAFHSLEDRIVKRFFTLRSGRQGAPSRHQPDRKPTHLPTFEMRVRGHIAASEEETRRNPRARSAKLRHGVRTSHAVWPSDLDALAVPKLLPGLLP